jgi:hypothetical protein
VKQPEEEEMTSQSDHSISTYNEITMMWPDGPQSMDWLDFTDTLPQMLFAQADNAATGAVHTSPQIPLAAHYTSAATLTHTPVVSAVAPASTATPMALTTQVTTRRRFRCPMPTCTRSFDRNARAEACHNRHLHQKPHVCPGGCGRFAW